jgi:hypothetical protein
MVKMTSSSNIVALKSSRGLTGLINKHLNDDVRDKLKNVRSELTGLNQRYMLWSEQEIDAWREGMENMVVEYNHKPSQRKNKSRRLRNVDEYVDKARAKLTRKGKPVKDDFYGTEFTMVSKLGNLYDWHELVERFGRKGIDEREVLSSLNEAFFDHADWFNSEYNDCGLSATQVFTNLDEVGAPHSHIHVVSTKVNEKTGLPVVNLGAILGDKYGHTVNQYNMSAFRNDVDEKLVECCSERLVELARSHGLNFEGLTMVRTNAKQVGLAHERYVEEQIIKSKIGERLENVEERERQLNAREEDLSNREVALNEREQKVDGLFDMVKNKYVEVQSVANDLERLVLDVPDFGEPRDRAMVEFMKNKVIMGNDGQVTNVYEEFLKQQSRRRNVVDRVRNLGELGFDDFER